MTEVQSTEKVNEVKKAKKPSVHVDKVNLTPEAISKVKSWLEQANSVLCGITINRTMIVNWLIGKQGHDLSGEELSQLESEFRNEVEFSKWAAREVEEASNRGEIKTLESIIEERKRRLQSMRAGVGSLSTTKKPPKKKKNSEPKIEATNASIEAPLAESESPPTSDVSLTKTEGVFERT